MELQFYRLKMSASHFGAGSLETAKPTLSSDAIFSALYIEALKLNCAEEFLSLARSQDFALSNMFMYHLGLFLPKPIGYPQREYKAADDGRIRAKLVKKINYINQYDLESFIDGEIEETEVLKDLVEEEKTMFTNASLTKKGDDPYRVMTTYYDKDTELVIVANKNNLLETLMESLQFTGLGGKKSTGYGQFELTLSPIDESLADRIVLSSNKPVMLLNDALPKKNELSEIMDGAKYLLTKSSGFAYSKETSKNQRKQDVYKFKEGSTFNKSFVGDIVDTAPKNFPHPVWNYAKPLFYELEGQNV